MAHNLDRFSLTADFENIAGEAARLNVEASTVRMYLDWYGVTPLTVKTMSGLVSMPAYELEIRRQVHGERLQRCQQLEMAFSRTRNQYSYEHRGW